MTLPKLTHHLVLAFNLGFMGTTMSADRDHSDERESNAPSPGTPFPNLASFQLEGTLPELKGKVLLVDFWASWCVPCKQSFKMLNRLHQRFGSEGLVVLAISVDEKAKDMKRFLAKNPAEFSVVRDATQKLVGALDVKAMPTSFIVDCDGRIHFVHSGYHEEETPKLYEQKIADLLRLSAAKQ